MNKNLLSIVTGLSLIMWLAGTGIWLTFQGSPLTVLAGVLVGMLLADALTTDLRRE